MIIGQNSTHVWEKAVEPTFCCSPDSKSRSIQFAFQCFLNRKTEGNVDALTEKTICRQSGFIIAIAEH